MPVQPAKNLWISATLWLSACASAPADIARINDAGNAHPYIHYARYDMHILAPGEGGNCSAIAWTKFHDLVKAGYSPEIRTCRLWTGEEHAFVEVEGWALDNRMSHPVREKQVGCEGPQ